MAEKFGLKAAQAKAPPSLLTYLLTEMGEKHFTKREKPQKQGQKVIERGL